ncbi:MAG: HVO_0476 family zinc finger protein [Thermoplasmatota archaeon]
MSEGSEIFFHCETCGSETPHRVLRGRIGVTSDEGFDGTAQCTECDTVHHVLIPVVKSVRVKMVVSDRDLSKKDEIELSTREEISVGDEFYHGDHNLKVTAIESAGKNVSRGLAGDVSMLYAKVFDVVHVKVAIVKGANTSSEQIEAAPDEEFAVGDILDFGRTKVIIEKIKLEGRTLYRQGMSAQAREIKRVYTKQIKERYY